MRAGRALPRRVHATGPTTTAKAQRQPMRAAEAEAAAPLQTRLARPLGQRLEGWPPQLARRARRAARYPALPPRVRWNRARSRATARRLTFARSSGSQSSNPQRAPARMGLQRMNSQSDRAERSLRARRPPHGATALVRQNPTGELRRPPQANSCNSSRTRALRTRWRDGRTVSCPLSAAGKGQLSAIRCRQLSSFSPLRRRGPRSRSVPARCCRAPISVPRPVRGAWDAHRCP